MPPPIFSKIRCIMKWVPLSKSRCGKISADGKHIIPVRRHQVSAKGVGVPVRLYITAGDFQSCARSSIVVSRCRIGLLKYPVGTVPSEKLGGIANAEFV